VLIASCHRPVGRAAQPDRRDDATHDASHRRRLYDGLRPGTGRLTGPAPRSSDQNDWVRLMLIRHAEPEAHIKGVVAGPRGCTGLTDRGRAQAAALSDRLARDAEQFDFLYSSVLARAVETAQIIAPTLGLSEIRQDCGLCELHPGECDGMAWEDQVRIYGRGANRDPDQPISPGGESLRSFDGRARAALDQLVERHAGDSIAVVTHGGFITVAMLALLGYQGIDAKRTFVLNPAYTSLTEWARQDRSGPWLLQRYNDMGHLAQLA